jgi:hypothetical protein
MLENANAPGNWREFVIGAIRGADGRQAVLRLGLRGRWRQRFAALLQRIAALAVSTVAQFTQDQNNSSPRPWEPRQSHFQPNLLPAFKFK